MHVTHHFNKKELIVQALVNYESLKQSAITHVQEKDKYDMEYLSQSCLDVFFCKAYLQDDKGKLALRDFIDALTARLLFSLNVSKQISYTFRNNTYTIIPEKRDYHVSTHLWNMAFFGATVLNDKKILEILSNMDLNALLTVSNKKKNYTYSMALALKAFYLKEKEYPDLLSKAIQETIELPTDNLLYDKALDIDGPALELLFLGLMERNEQFNEKLLMALEWHKKYYKRLENKNIQDNTGLISLPICAMVLFAKRIKNFTIAHSSDYLPGYLLEI
jgi:hypothetical protein